MANLQKYLQLHHGCSFLGINRKLQELIRASVSTKLASQNFGFGDLRSVQCYDLTIIRQWENVEMPLFLKNEWKPVIYLTIFLY